MPALWNFQKADLEPYPYGKKYTTFSFPIHGALASNMCLRDALHAHVFSFTHNTVVLSHFRCVHPENQTKIFRFLTFLWIKTNVAYTRLEVIAKQRSVLLVEFITGVKLICYFVLYYCFLHWAHLPNMAVGDLAFYYTLYLWFSPRALPRSSQVVIILIVVTLVSDY